MVLMNLLGLMLLATPLATAQGDQRLDILSFAATDAKEWQRLHRRSDAPPLRLADIDAMAAAGMGQGTLTELIRTRRILDRVAPQDLIALKKKGVDDEVIAAISAHALPENRSIELLLTVDVRSTGTLARAPHLYVEFYHRDRKEPEHLLYADLRALLARGNVVTDRSDPLLPNQFRRVQLRGAVPLRHPGKIEARLLLSHKPQYTTLSGLDAAEQKRLKRWQFEMPPVSLYRDCELHLGLSRDELLPERMAIERERFFCRFD